MLTPSIAPFLKFTKQKSDLENCISILNALKRKLPPCIIIEDSYKIDVCVDD